jgi:molybdate-binding protein/DNA-binding transcriptional regulator YhcF (GntR family)
MTTVPGEQPLYRAIAAEIVRRIARGELAPGARLPAVRAAAAEWGVNLNTVAHAYAHLAAQGIVETRAGGGTRVSRAAGETAAEERAARLRTLLAEAIGTALGLGYDPSEVEASFGSQMARWRGARATAGAAAEPRTARDDAETLARGEAGVELVRVAGSHDLSLELLSGWTRGEAVRVTWQPSSSLGGLFALASGDCDLAGCHLLDAESGEYNAPFVRRVLPGEPVDLITLAEREQGLIVATGNPLGIREVGDVARPGVRYVNRPRGAGTRVLLDHLLAGAAIAASAVVGYEREEPTHLAVAGAIAAGTADAGLGIGAAARALGLGFVPLARERYELALRPATAERVGVRSVLGALSNPAFAAAVEALDGYDTREMGGIRRVG